MKEEKNKKLNIYQRILAVMADVDYVLKEDKKVNNQYKFVSHDAVTATIHPQLVKHGIVMLSDCENLTQNGNRTEIMMSFDFINVDDPTDRFNVRYPGYGIDPQDKGVGKAISYAVKYCLLKTFCLETGDDVERDNIDHQEEKITRDQAEEISFLCAERDDLLAKILKKCPKGQLINLQASRYEALVGWLRNELEKKGE